MKLAIALNLAIALIASNSWADDIKAVDAKTVTITRTVRPPEVETVAVPDLTAKLAELKHHKDQLQAQADNYTQLIAQTDIDILATQNDIDASNAAIHTAGLDVQVNADIQVNAENP